MTTAQNIESAATMAQSLHASLAGFALDTLEPTQKTAYQEMANAVALIHRRLQARLGQMNDMLAERLPKK